MNQPDELERMAAALEASGDYRVVRRLGAPAFRPAPEGALPRRGLIVDVETTGKDPAADRIIQMAALSFEYCARTGAVLSASEPSAWLEDPGVPIPPDIARLTRISDQDVRGQRLDEDVLSALANAAGLVIAHNAAFDRRFVERRLPAFRVRPWACSMAEVPWSDEGLGSAGLESLLYRHCGRFADAHRADADCLATLALLATPLPSGRSPLLLLLESARRPTVRLWASGAPIEVKDALKARGYRWRERAGGRTWCVDLAPGEEADECAWLSAAVYGGAGRGWESDRFGADRRYADGY